ncbi:unnamed protein product, partial [Polarella glacialis]
VLEEELRALEETRRSNANLEESCLSLREDLEDMRRQREQVLEEAAEEARLLSLEASLRPPKKGEPRASKAERAFDDDRSSHQPEDKMSWAAPLHQLGRLASGQRGLAV